jgi:peptidoglycan/LPS O-acetylase OafA/YrhL
VRPEPFHLGYRPALDGLRGVAILAVMLDHSGLLTGGWLGVDVFFTLSGFLITSLLLEEHARTGSIRFRAFYARRALRLLPALFLMVGVCGPIIIAASPPRLVTVRLLFVAAIVFYVANWAIIAGIFAFPLGHTWSLAIEEQFYALWPPALVLLLRWIRRRGIILTVVLGGIAATIVWRTALRAGGAGTTRLFVGLDTRADSLLIGCALAMLTTWHMLPASPRTQAARRWAGVGAAVGLSVLFAVAQFPKHFLDYRGPGSAAFATALVISAVLLPSSRLGRLLETRPLVSVGSISYGLYLWHFPIFVALGVPSGKLGVPGLMRLALAWSVTFAVCALSFRFVEAPALKLKSRLAMGPGAGAYGRADLKESDSSGSAQRSP